MKRKLGNRGQSSLQERSRLAVLGQRGQTTVEYLLTTGATLVIFTSMYKFTFEQLTILFRKGAIFILKAYF